MGLSEPLRWDKLLRPPEARVRNGVEGEGDDTAGVTGAVFERFALMADRGFVSPSLPEYE